MSFHALIKAWNFLGVPLVSRGNIIGCPSWASLGSPKTDISRLDPIFSLLTSAFYIDSFLHRVDTLIVREYINNVFGSACFNKTNL